MNLQFADLLRIARRRGVTDVHALSELTGCSTKCGSCRPYLEELLRSGKVRVGDQLFTFPDPDAADDDLA